MPKPTRVVIGGVDTHGRTHHAAVIDQQGRLLGDREFAADSSGYQQLRSWLRRHGRLDAVGVEGTGSYGAGLTRYLLDHGIKVIEIDRPDRRLRRQRGKSDPINAEAAARAVLAGTATAAAKPRHGIVETIRALRAAAAARSRRGPPPSTSSKACWSPRRPRYEKPWTGRPPLGWLPPAPGSGPTRPPLRSPSTASRQRCARSPSASSSSTRRSAWPTSGSPSWSAVPRPDC
jgi:hypothetical protein